MEKGTISTELLDLLNQAIARELQVCIQYMLQHAVGAGQYTAASGGSRAAALKFVASHASFWLPGATLKKVAITEMTHCEAIAERVTLLGEEPTTQAGAVTIGKTVKEMLESNRELEQGAIELYRRIIDLAKREQDGVTARLFERILADEEKHHRTFSDLLARE